MIQEGRDEELFAEAYDSMLKMADELVGGKWYSEFCSLADGLVPNASIGSTSLAYLVIH